MENINITEIIRVATEVLLIIAGFFGGKKWQSRKK